MFKIEVIEKVYHTATLSDEDEQKILDYIKNNPDEFEYMLDKVKITTAVYTLYGRGELDLYKDTVESDMETEDICWSQYEERTAEEILSQIQGDE